MDKSRYPIGQLIPILNLSIEERNNLIEQVPEISNVLQGISKKLNETQLHTPYRHNGWSPQQIVHHMADNDMNAYLRLKRALTEDEPLSDSYREDLWAELNDYKDTPIETSINLLTSLHSRFYILLRSLSSDEFYRRLWTQVLGTITIETALQRFIWHNHHHISQMKSLINNTG